MVSSEAWETKIAYTDTELGVSHSQAQAASSQGCITGSVPRYLLSHSSSPHTAALHTSSPAYQQPCRELQVPTAYFSSIPSAYYAEIHTLNTLPMTKIPELSLP